MIVTGGDPEATGTCTDWLAEPGSRRSRSPSRSRRRTTTAPAAPTAAPWRRTSPTAPTADAADRAAAYVTQQLAVSRHWDSRPRPRSDRPHLITAEESPHDRPPRPHPARDRRPDEVPVTRVALTNGETFDRYCTEGPGCDPQVGLPPARAGWIEERGDTETYDGRPTQLVDNGRTAVRRGEAREEWQGERRAAASDAGKPSPRWHYARRRASSPRRWSTSRCASAATSSWSAQEVAAGPRDHPGQRQPPRVRADDHRPALPGEDQRQHRQLRGHQPRSRRRSTSSPTRSPGAPTP